MNAKHVYSLVKFALALFVVFFIGATLWSAKNVIEYFWHDPMRVFVVGAGLVASVVLYWRHAINAVERLNRVYLITVGVTALVVLIMSLAFVFLDYSINLFGTFDALDQRIKTSVSVAVWITSVLLLVCNFALAVLHKTLYPKEEMPISIVVSEIVAAFFCIWANAWGTSDAVYKLTQDGFSANAMAVTIDFVIFLMGAWYLIANDKSTAAITLWTVIAGIGTTTFLQIVDGVLSGANYTATQDIKAIAQFAFPAILFISMGLVTITFFVDYFNGGLSLGSADKKSGEQRSPINHRPERPIDDRPDRRPDQPNFNRPRPHRPQERVGQGGNRNESFRKSQDSPSSAKKQQHERHPDDYEPTEVTPNMAKGMRERGYSPNAISGMTAAEVMKKLQTEPKKFKELEDGTLRPIVREPVGQGQSKNGTQPKN